MRRDSIKTSVWLGVVIALLLNLAPIGVFAAKPKPSKTKAAKTKQKQSKSSDRRASARKSARSGKTAKTARRSRSTSRAVRNVAAVAPESENQFVRKTSDAAPVLADVEIPGASGVLVETLEGKPVIDSYSDYSFNPASNVKVATAYAVLKVFGPEFRFQTNVWTDGDVDTTTGTLIGNLYVSGRDPMFSSAHAVSIARELNKIGIQSVTGDLIVTDNFAMNQSGNPTGSANALYSALTTAKRTAAATRAWETFLLYSGRFGETLIPGVTFGGTASVQPIPSRLQLLFSHESVPMKEILKVTLCYSNNFLSDRLGEMVGGPYAVARLVQQGVGVPPEEFNIQTSSGLGINRVTPRAMMRLLRVLRDDLAKYKMTFADIMPVAGVDEGTLAGRFAAGLARGSVVGKTGTLGQTDAGVSSLSGEISTAKGPVLFVIFNQRGSVPRFRSFQNFYVSVIQGQFGGAVPMAYNTNGLQSRLAGTRISYPERGSRAED